MLKHKTSLCAANKKIWKTEFKISVRFIWPGHGWGCVVCMFVSYISEAIQIPKLSLVYVETTKHFKDKLIKFKRWLLSHGMLRFLPKLNFCFQNISCWHIKVRNSNWLIITPKKSPTKYFVSQKLCRQIVAHI